MKQIIRLTESDLHRLVKESVQKILREMDGVAMGDGSGLSSPTGSELANNERVAGATSDYSNGQYTVRGVGKDDFYKKADSRPVGDIAMNKSEKPVGHKG